MGPKSHPATAGLIG